MYVIALFFSRINKHSFHKLLIKASRTDTMCLNVMTQKNIIVSSRGSKERDEMLLLVIGTSLKSEKKGGKN
jgi:hypothetical protein